MTEGACAKIIRDGIILFTRSPSVSHALDSSLPEGADDMRCEHTEKIFVVHFRGVKVPPPTTIFECEHTGRILVVHLRTAREVGPYNRTTSYTP